MTSLRLRGRDRGEAAGDRAVEPAQPAEVGAALRSNSRRWAGSAAASAALDLPHGGLGVAGVVPPVRVVLRRLGPALLAREAIGDAGAEVDHLRAAAAVVDDLGDPGSRSSPLAKTSLALAAASMSLGRGSYSCGSVFGCRTWSTATAVAADLARPVADLGRRRHDLEPAGAGARPPAAAGEQGGRATTAAAATATPGRASASASARAAATTAKTAPATQAIVAPGGASVLTESQSPTRPRAATSASSRAAS